ncbi:hypothetical protein H2248_011919 [Termitomyces sp. 'cryptogamus']|nr:hypothetical protein H2248_011919 [Termitomyces sp. 'cryptogamus']
MDITQLILIIRDQDYAHGTEVLFANLYVSMFGVLFATVASGHAWGRSHGKSDQFAFETTISEEPGYVRSGTDASAASSDTRVSGSKKLQQPHNGFSQGNGRIPSGPDCSIRHAICVEQVVLKSDET